MLFSSIVVWEQMVVAWLFGYSSFVVKILFFIVFVYFSYMFVLLLFSENCVSIKASV